MCLYITKQNKEPKIASKPIECYKVLLRSRINPMPNEYKTPYRNVAVKLGSLVKAMGDCKLSDLKWISPYSRYKFYVSSGYIHTFKTIEGARRFARQCFWESYRDGSLIIVKCSIPTGSVYYEGAFESLGIMSYASSSLYYGKTIVYKKVK